MNASGWRQAWAGCLLLGLAACRTALPPPEPLPPPVPMTSEQARAAGLDPLIAHLVTSAHRTPAFRQRDTGRHPAQTLTFFGIDPHDTIVEIWPGGGWYTELLAPFVRDWGQYYAALPPVEDPSGDSFFAGQRRQFLGKLNSRPDLYGRVRIAEAGRGVSEIVPADTADYVLSFRNVHNWMCGGYESEMFRAFHLALKPGGVLGIVEHRALPNTDLETMKRTGYVTEAYVRELAEAAGFELLDASEVNANAKDSTEHPEGVWTLPPTLRLGEQDRERYLSIGESDRMTLKFSKPRWR